MGNITNQLIRELIEIDKNGSSASAEDKIIINKIVKFLKMKYIVFFLNNLSENIKSKDVKENINNDDIMSEFINGYLEKVEDKLKTKKMIKFILKLL